jgi:hypothetical protein
MVRGCDLINRKHHNPAHASLGFYARRQGVVDPFRCELPGILASYSSRV